MIKKIDVPQFDVNMIEVTIGQWFKSIGDYVEKGDVLVEMITDKAVFEYESPESGTLLAILAEEKSILPVHYIIAVLGEKGADVPDFTEDNRSVLDLFNKNVVGEIVSEESVIVNKRKRKDRIRSTPAARRLAKENGIELKRVKEHFDVDMVKEIHIKEYLEEFDNG